MPKSTSERRKLSLLIRVINKIACCATGAQINIEIDERNIWDGCIEYLLDVVPVAMTNTSHCYAYSAARSLFVSLMAFVIFAT